MGKYEGFIKFQEYTRNLEKRIEALEAEKAKLIQENHNYKMQFHIRRTCCGCKWEHQRRMNMPCVRCGRSQTDLYEEDV